MPSKIDVTLESVAVSPCICRTAGSLDATPALSRLDFSFYTSPPVTKSFLANRKGNAGSKGYIPVFLKDSLASSKVMLSKT